ncbi:nucleotidyltransferase domain-containing protein [Rothia sp. SD9660Na]|nr:nucleotidyltransferase domain-containing protein [Rothia sp. SD9660Na]WHS51524.1 nucleotidyltransferase domain-containing protein [Rothia sp. SD9660Na]
MSGLCEQYGVARLEVFGSVAKGLATDASDIDIHYTMKPGRRMSWDIDDLATALGEVFGGKVDLVARKYVHPLLA